MSEAMRAEFEKRATADGKFMRAVEKNADGGYRLVGTAADWANWQDAWQASRATRSSAWQPPETAPKAGTFLADVGWPWPVVAMWSEAADCWIYADVQHSLFEGEADPIFVNETDDKLRAWMPLPSLIKTKPA